VKAKITRIVELSYLQLVIIFLILVLLKELGVLNFPVYYQYFILVLPLFALPHLLRREKPEETHVPGVLIIILVIFMFALLLRFLPLVNSSVPLGYDPGFYKYTMDSYANALPRIPEAGLETWIKEMYPQGLPVLTDMTYVVAGADAMDNIRYLFPFLGALLVFPVFMVTRNIFGQRAGIIAAALYAISYTQYQVFTYFYLKNVLGLLFLLLAIYALDKEKYVLMALMFAALGIFHRPEFLLFTLILVPFFLLHRRREILYAVLGTIILVIPFWVTRWGINWGVLSGVVKTAVTNIQTGGGLGGGTFFDFDTYTKLAIAYLPFALIGGIYLAIKRNWNSVFFFLIISAIIVIARLFFFNRFIIPLDIAVMVMAAVGIDYTLLNRERVWRTVGIGAGIILLAAALTPTIHAIIDTEPLITEEQLEAVEWLADNTEDNAFVLATTNDAPWVLGWSERKVIAPGLFEWDLYEKEEWEIFFNTDDPEIAEQFLDRYDSPVYIYYSFNPSNYLGLEKFQGQYFQILYNNGAVIYRYRGGD
jgi:asparagine N-glycosylation enzyme membrane subunit Stt3